MDDSWATSKIEDFLPPREPDIDDWKRYASQLEKAVDKKDELLEEARSVAREVIGGFTKGGLLRRGYEANFEWLLSTSDLDCCCEDESNGNGDPCSLKGEGDTLEALRTHLGKEAKRTRGVKAWEQ